MKEPEKTIAELLTGGFFFTVGLAMFASLASYTRDLMVKQEEHSWKALISQITAAALTGVITYMLGVKFELGIEYIAAISSIGGWAGTRTMQFLENLLKNWALHHVEKEKSMMGIVKETLADTVNQDDKKKN
jgi:hypothetical protein